MATFTPLLTYAAAPTVITQGASNTTVTTVLPRAAVSPNGIHTFAGFVYGAASYNLDGFTGLTQDMGSGTGTNTAAITINNLLQGTRYYYAGVASNTSGQVVTGAVDNAVTTQVTYNWVPSGICNIDTNRPQGSEPGSVWDDVARLIETGLANALLLEHDCTGHHQDGFITPGMLGSGTVGLGALGPDAVAFILSAGGSNANFTVTNALYFLSNISTTPPTNIALTAGVGFTNRLATLSVASNTLSHIMLEADFGLSAADRLTVRMLRFTVPSPLTNKDYAVVSAGHYPTVENNDYLPFHLSGIFAGGNTNTITLNLDLVVTGNGGGVVMHDFRAWGIP